MKKNLFLLLIAVVLGTTKSTAQGDLYEKHLFVKGLDTLPYRLLLPENYDSKKIYPLILFLHGAGERGRDNAAQLKHGSSLFLRDSIRSSYPAIVVFPQCPANSYWSNVFIKIDTATHIRTFNFRKHGRPTQAMLLLLQLLPQLNNKYKTDPTHRYVVGLSMGGMGTFELVRRMPEYFAAAIPICGGGSIKTAKKLKHTAWWIFHGAKDDVVPPYFSRAMADALKQVNSNVKLTIYPDANHNSWDNAFAEKDLLHWLFSLHK